MALANQLPEGILQQRPRLSAQLDRAVMQQLLNTIEQPHIASSLKMGYFGGRASTQDLPVAEGFALLKSAIEKEPAASKRWFWLQNVRGWAGFRCREISPDEGFAAYSELFAQADKARAVGTVYAPQNALNEWVATVGGRLGMLGLRDDERTSQVLLSAWTAYASLLKQTEGRWNGREPDWKQALERAGASEELVAAVEKTLADQAVPKTFGLLLGAASALRDEKPERAIELLGQAKPLLPRDRAGQVEARIAEEYFALRLSLLEGEDRNREVLSVAQERVTVLGSDHAKLLKLQLEHKDEAGVAATLALLMNPAAPEREIVAAAAVLNARWDEERKSEDRKGEEGKKDETLAAQSQSLLQSYLQAGRKKSIPLELEARWRLGWLLWEQGKRDEAKAALEVSALRFDEARLDAATNFILQKIRALQAKTAG